LAECKHLLCLLCAQSGRNGLKRFSRSQYSDSFASSLCD
jgi:hypothetical protein